MRREWIGLIFALLTPAWAQTPAELLGKIEEVYSKAESLKCRFDIETVNQAIGETETESGELWVSRPDRMKWQYHTPEGKLLLLDGRYQWMFLPEEKQAFRGEQQDASSELTLTLLADPGTLERRFEVSLEPNAPPAEGLTFLHLQPRQPTEELRYLLLGVETSSGKVLALHVMDKFDNPTRIRFSELEFNPRLSPKIFELKLPKGTELLDFQGEPIRD